MGVTPIPVVQVPATNVVIKSMVITLVNSQGDSYAMCIYIYIIYIYIYMVSGQAQ